MLSLYLLSFIMNSAYAHDPLFSIVQDVAQAEKLVKDAGVMEDRCNNSPEVTRKINNAPLALQCLNSLCPKDDSAVSGSALNPYQLIKVDPKHKMASNKKFNLQKNEIDKSLNGFVDSSNKLIDELATIQKDDKPNVDKSNLVLLLGKNLSLRSTETSPVVDLNNSEKMTPEELNILESLKKSSEAFLEKNQKIMKRNRDDFNFTELKKHTSDLINKYKEKNELGLSSLLQKDLDSKNIDSYELTKKIVLAEAIDGSQDLQNISQNYLQEKFKAIDLSAIKKSVNTDFKQSYPKLIKANLLYKEAHNCDPKQFKQMVKEVKDNYKKNVFPKFSDETRERLNQYIDNEIRFAIDEESTFPKGKEKALAKSINTQTDNINKTLSEENKNAIVAYAFNNYANYLGMPVDEFQSPNLTDNFNDELRSFGQTNISALSCANPEIGKDVITHEIGHAISSLFQMAMSENAAENDVVKNFRLNSQDYKKFLNTRKCLSSYHVQEVPLIDELKHPNDTYRVEEDMADWFVTQANPGNTKFMTCALLTSIPKHDVNYTDLEFLNDRLFREDTHSMPFFRILNEAFQGNKLGFKCESFIKENEHLIRLKKCE